MYSGLKSLVRYIIFKYFLPLCRLSFHFLDSVHETQKNFNFDIVQFVYFFFCYLWFWFVFNKSLPNLRPPHVRSWLIGKDPDVGRDWGKKRKGTTEDEKAGWHHRLDGRWVWVNSGSWWWTGRPGVLWFMGSQRVGHNWATELN